MADCPRISSAPRFAAMKARPVIHAGSDAQRAEAARILGETRRSLYRLLAEDDPAHGPGPGAPARAARRWAHASTSSRLRARPAPRRGTAIPAARVGTAAIASEMATTSSQGT